MPSGAPPPMQFANLQFSDKPKTNLGTQMQDLGKNLKKAGVGNLLQPTPPAVVPGAAVPGVQGPTSAGGPQGPMPLVAPGTPGPSVAPPAAAPPPMAPGAAPAPPAPVPGQPPQPFSTGGAPPVYLPQIISNPPRVNPTQNMTPPQMLDWLKRMTGVGQSVIPPGQPGSAALQGAGLLPSSPGFGAPPMMPQPPISS
jgi:hypothetical protein